MTKVTQWDFLDCCSHAEWKFVTELRNDISAKHGHVSIAQIFLFIQQLEDRGFIETEKFPDPSHDDQLRLRIKKTSAGIRARIEACERETSSSHGFGLKPA